MVSDELSRPAVPEVAPRERQRRPIYSVVVPVYRNEETLSAVVERLDGLADELDGGLEYPHYTRPPEFRGWRVPDILLSGDHGRIDEWRIEQSRLRTP